MFYVVILYREAVSAYPSGTGFHSILSCYCMLSSLDMHCKNILRLCRCGNDRGRWCESIQTWLGWTLDRFHMHCQRPSCPRRRVAAW